MNPYYSLGHQINNRQNIAARITPILFLLLATMIVISVATTTPQTTGGTPQQNSNHGNPVREGAPPIGAYWARAYGGSGNEVAKAIQQTSDGGYIVAGSTSSFGAGLSDFWVMKLNSTGSVTWQKVYGSSGDDVANSIEQTTDGGYIVAGQTAPYSTYYDFWVLKLNSTGGVTWQKRYGGNLDDVAYSAQQTADGGYIVAGYTRSFGSGGTGGTLGWVLKLNPTGSLTWQKMYDRNQNSVFSSIEQTADEGYIVSGRSLSNGMGYDFWVLKLDSTGSVTGFETYGGSGNDVSCSAQQTADGGYIVAGQTTSFGAGLNDTWVLKLSSPYMATWAYTYGGSGNDYVSSANQTADGGYIVAGYTNSFGAGSWDFWLLKLNPSGAVTWQKTYGGSGDDVANSIEQTADGGYIVAGYTHSFGSGGTDVWILKLNSTGSVEWDEGSDASTHTTNAVPIYPSYTTGNPPPSVAYGNSSASPVVSAVTPADTSAPVTMQAPDTTSPATITDLTASSQTDSSITLTWTAPGDSGMRGNATAYIVKYSTLGSVDASNWQSATTYLQNWTPVKNGTMETRVVSGLSNATRYWFAVEAYDEIPNFAGVSNSPAAVTLDAFPPAAIINLATSSPTTTSITLTWTAPGDNGTLGTATGYVVKYSTTGPINASNWASATTYTQSWTPFAVGDVETHVISGLNSGTTYWFSVVAYDKVPNYGAVSNSPSATTEVDYTIVLVGGGAAALVAVVAVAAVLASKRKKV